MAFRHGRTAAVWYGGLDVSPYLRGADLSLEVGVADTTTFGASWRTFIPGPAGGGYEFEGLYEPTPDIDIQGALSAVGVLTVCPGGRSVGDLVRLVPCITSSYGQSSVIDDVVGFSWGVTAEDAIAAGTVIHALTEDTNTTTGSGIDQAAATSTGWTAHLHVTLVDGGSWVITVEDSADGSSGWAAIATFAAVTVPGAARLLSASSTTAVRRHVRVVATRTGGSAGQGITYALGFARTNQ